MAKRLEKGIERRNNPARWEALVEVCHELPMGADLPTIQEMADHLNGKALETNMEFLVLPVIEGEQTPNVAPLYHDGKNWMQAIKAESAGPVIRSILDQLPQSVKDGTDPIYEVHQIRLDDFNSMEHLMGMSSLLSVFLVVRSEGDACYFFPMHPESSTNWEIFKDMHAEQFPQLGEG